MTSFLCHFYLKTLVFRQVISWSSCLEIPKVCYSYEIHVLQKSENTFGNSYNVVLIGNFYIIINACAESKIYIFQLWNFIQMSIVRQKWVFLWLQTVNSCEPVHRHTRTRPFIICIVCMHSMETKAKRRTDRILAQPIPILHFCILSLCVWPQRTCIAWQGSHY